MAKPQAKPTTSKRTRKRPSPKGPVAPPPKRATELSRYQMKILGMLRPGRRPHAALLQLWNDTISLWRTAKLKYWMVRDTFPADQRRTLERDYERFEIRMRNYKRVLDLRPIHQGNLDAAVVRGFLVDDGSGHIADFLFPVTFTNQADAVLETMQQALREFFIETPRNIERAILEGIEDAGDALEDGITWQRAAPWMAAVAGSVVAGLIVAKATRK